MKLLLWDREKMECDSPEDHNESRRKSIRRIKVGGLIGERVLLYPFLSLLLSLSSIMICIAYSATNCMIIKKNPITSTTLHCTDLQKIWFVIPCHFTMIALIPPPSTAICSTGESLILRLCDVFFFTS